MKEFNTSTTLKEREGTAEEQVWKFKVDGREVTAYMATAAQIAVVLSKVSRHTQLTTKIAGIIDFLMAVMDQDDASWLSERLLDRNDTFGIEEVQNIMSWLIEEWGGHPTDGQSGSSSSPSGTGPTSMQAGSETSGTSPGTAG